MGAEGITTGAMSTALMMQTTQMTEGPTADFAQKGIQGKVPVEMIMNFLMICREVQEVQEVLVDQVDLVVLVMIAASKMRLILMTSKTV